MLLKDGGGVIPYKRKVTIDMVRTRAVVVVVRKLLFLVTWVIFL